MLAAAKTAKGIHWRRREKMRYLPLSASFIVLVVAATHLRADEVIIDFENIPSGTFIGDSLKESTGLTFNGHFVTGRSEETGSSYSEVRFMQSSSPNIGSIYPFDVVSFDYQLAGQSRLQVVVFGLGADGLATVVGRAEMTGTAAGEWKRLTVEVGAGSAIHFGYIVRDTQPPIIDNITIVSNRNGVTRAKNERAGKRDIERQQLR